MLRGKAAYYALKVESLGFFQTFVNFYQTVRRHILENNNFHSDAAAWHQRFFVELRGRK
jgi:hypothetical protein